MSRTNPQSDNVYMKGTWCLQAIFHVMKAILPVSGQIRQQVKIGDPPYESVFGENLGLYCNRLFVECRISRR